MTRSTMSAHDTDDRQSGTGGRNAMGVEGSESVARVRHKNAHGNVNASSQAAQKPHKRHGKPGKAVIVAIVVAIAAAGCGVAWYVTHSGNGMSTVGVGTTTINTDSTDLQANDLGSLYDFAEEKEHTDSIGGGTVMNSLAVGNDDGTAVTVDTKMSGVDDGWCGTVVLFDKDGKELGRGDVSMPPDMGGSSETMQYIEVDASQVAYWKLYSTDAVDASADFSGIDVIGTDNGNDNDNANDNANDTSNATGEANAENDADNG